MITKREEKFIRSLSQKKYRKEYDAFVVEGAKMVLELLQSDWPVSHVFYADSFDVDDLLVEQNPDTEFVLCEAEKINRLSLLKTNKQVLAIADIREGFSSNDDENNPSPTLVLDNIQDPGNLGTIIRTADWFGIKEVICSEECVDFYNPKVITSTKGFFLRLAPRYQNLEEYLNTVKGEKTILAATMEGANYNEIAKDSKPFNGVILMGSESHGIQESLLNMVDKCITIPSYGEAESLNVAVATGILLSQFAHA